MIKTKEVNVNLNIYAVKREDGKYTVSLMLDNSFLDVTLLSREVTASDIDEAIRDFAYSLESVFNA